MFTIEKAPVEVWLQIFEHLDLKGLIKLHNACGTIWGTLVARAAAKSIGSFLIEGKPNPFAHVECPTLCFKHSIERKDPAHIFWFGTVLTWHPCVPLSDGCYSRAFQRYDSGLSEMSLELICDSNCFHVENDFHTCCNGPEPVEMTTFIIDFISSEDKDIKIRFEYLTTFTTPSVTITETPEDNGHINRTISHKLKLNDILYNNTASNDPHKWEPLPKEWVNFFDPEVSVSMTFTRDPRKSQHIRGYRTVDCVVSELTAFKATWNFKWIPSAKMGKMLREGDRRKFYERR